MKQEITDRYPPDSLSVLIVWSPMMDDDNEKTARNAGGMFGSNVKQFYDPNRLVGRAYRDHVFPDASRQAAPFLDDGYWLKDWLADHEEFGAQPEWDIYMFFAPGTRWEKLPPAPPRFVRHLGRFVADAGDGEPEESVMWVNTYASATRDAVLADVIRELAEAMMKRATVAVPQR